MNIQLKAERRLAFTLLAPSLLILIIIAIYPLGSVFYTSMTNRTFAGSKEVDFKGFDNYIRLLGMTVVERPLDGLDDEGNSEYKSSAKVLPRTPFRYKVLREFSIGGRAFTLGAGDPDFIRAICDTIVFSFCSVTLELLAGLFLAMVLTRHFRGRSAMRVAMLVPWAIPTAVSSRMWEWMLTSTRAGFLNILSQKIGLSDGQFPFLVNETSQLICIIAIDVWKTTPFMALLLMAGLQMIPGELYEAAYVDGCGPFSQFRKVTLPLLRSTIFVALIFRTLDAMRVFGLFQIIFAQKRFSLASFAYYELVNNKAMGYSSAAGVIIFLIIIVFNILYIRLSGGIHSEK